jgi:hypothetical protein
LVLDDCEVQVAILALPLIFQFIVALGALAPDGAVKVAVKVRVEFSTPPPMPTTLKVGVTLVMVIGVDATAATAL